VSKEKYNREYIVDLLSIIADKLKNKDSSGLALLDGLGTHIIYFNEAHDPIVVVTGIILDFASYGLRIGVQLSSVRGMFPPEIKNQVDKVSSDMVEVGNIVEELKECIKNDDIRKLIENCAKLIGISNKYMRLRTQLRGLEQLMQST